MTVDARQQLADAMGHKPMTQQRSKWRRVPSPMPGAVCAERNVSDGVLAALVTNDPDGLHLSISHRRFTAKGVVLVRYPTWDEIVDARDTFLPDDRGFVMHLPAAGEFVALHATTFHLHQENR